MNQGVEILIARMQSNPEDFLYNGRFHHFADTLTELAGGRAERVKYPGEGSHPLYFLTDEERQALSEAWTVCARDKFTTDVMKSLIENPNDANEYRYYPQGAQIKASGMPVQGVGVYNTNATNPTATQVAMQQQALQTELLRAEMDQRAKYAQQNPAFNSYNKQSTKLQKPSK